MLIPVGGPFAAIPFSQSIGVKVWATLVGLGQSVGFALGLTGTVLFATSKPKRRVSFAPVPTRDGGLLSTSVRF